MLIRLDGVAPTQIVGVSASCYPSEHRNVHKKLSSGTSSPGWSREKGRCEAENTSYSVVYSGLLNGNNRKPMKLSMCSSRMLL